MADIKVSSEQLESMAGEIKVIGSELDSIIGEAGGLVNQISSVWEGLAQASFMADYNSQKQNLAQLVEIVAGLGSQVSQVAAAWSETESGLSAR